MSIKRHADVIEALKADFPSAQTRGFKKSLLELISELEGDELGDEIDVIKDIVVFVPDLYVVRRDPDEVLVFEVIDTHSIDHIKKWKLAWGWYALDNFYVPMRLFICDQFGGRNEVDLRGWLEEVVSSNEYPKGWPQAYRRSRDA